MLMARAVLVVLPSLFYWRHSRGVTQERLAERIGMNRNTVGRIDRGGSTFMRTARLLARALGVRVADLTGEPPNPAS
jgi:transcriptional regulator with XRE-family HTH domain